MCAYLIPARERRAQRRADLRSSLVSKSASLQTSSSVRDSVSRHQDREQERKTHDVFFGLHMCTHGQVYLHTHRRISNDSIPHQPTHKRDVKIPKLQPTTKLHTRATYSSVQLLGILFRSRQPRKLHPFQFHDLTWSNTCCLDNVLQLVPCVSIYVQCWVNTHTSVCILLIEVTPILFGTKVL